MNLNTIINNLKNKQEKESKNKILISDLDKTLIFSDKEKELCKDNNNICVEYKKGQPLSYMTKKSNQILYEIINKNIIFIPCTMRSLEQAQRIEFIQPNLCKYIVCFNGCELYIDNKLSRNYELYIQEFLNQKGIEELYNKYSNLYKDLRVLSFKNYYFEIKARNLEEKNNILFNLKKELDLNQYKIFVVSLKIYIMPKNIDKINALKYIQTHLLRGLYYGMGDSLIDESFVNYCDYSFVPKHSEFNPKIINGYKSNKNYIISGEDLLLKLKECL